MCIPNRKIPSTLSSSPSRNKISLEDGKIVARCVRTAVTPFEVPCTVEATGRLDWGGGNVFYFEHGTLDLIKLVKRRRIDVTCPDQVEIIDFGDRLLNLPRLVLAGADRMVNAVESLNALIEFLTIADGHEHECVSLSLALTDHHEMKTISVAGEVGNLASWLRVAAATFPTEPKRLTSWLTEIVRVTVTKRLVSAPGSIGIDATTFRFPRDWSSPGDFSSDWHQFIRQALDEGIPDRDLHNLVPIYRVNRSVCGRCHREYQTCPHIRRIDFATFETMQDIQIIGAHRRHSK